MPAICAYVVGGGRDACKETPRPKNKYFRFRPYSFPEKGGETSPQCCTFQSRWGRRRETSFLRENGETGSIKIRGNQVLPSRNLDRLFAPYLSMGGGKRKKLRNSFSLFHSVKYAKRRVGRRREQKEKKLEQ